MKQTISNLPKSPVKVVLVEDKPAVRDSWIKLIDSLPGFSCVQACTSGEDALRVIPPLNPDVVLMDIFLPRMSGIECTARLKLQLPKIQILILTAVEDDELVFMALEAGADGYLLKRTTPEDLRAAMLDVLGGGAPMTSEIARRVVESFRRASKQQQKPRLKLQLPKVQILILTVVEEDELVFMALEAGAHGYLLKRTTPADLRAALLDVLGGAAQI